MEPDYTQNPLHPIDLSLFKDHIKNSFLTLIDQVKIKILIILILTNI